MTNKIGVICLIIEDLIRGFGIRCVVLAEKEVCSGAGQYRAGYWEEEGLRGGSTGLMTGERGSWGCRERTAQDEGSESLSILQRVEKSTDYRVGIRTD